MMVEMTVEWRAATTVEMTVAPSVEMKAPRMVVPMAGMKVVLRVDSMAD